MFQVWFLIICPTDTCQMSWKLVQRLRLCKISTFYFLFVYCLMVDIWTLFVNKLVQTICIFHVFLVQVASVHRVRFLLCWCLMVDKRTLLNCKTLIKLVKDSEWTKSKMLLFCIVLVYLCTCFHDFWQISVGQMIKNHTWNMFYVHVKCKFLIFKFSKVMQQHT